MPGKQKFRTLLTNSNGQILKTNTLQKLYKLFVLVILALLFNNFSNNVFAQDVLGWQWENPLPQGTALNDMWGESADNIYAVGDGGTILHFDGVKWTVEPVDAKDWSYGIWGSGANNIYAVGLRAVLHYNGISWNRTEIDAPGYLYGIWGTSASNIYAVGEVSTIMHYDGNTWTAMPNNANRPLYDVWGTSPTNVYAVGYSGTIVHYDGGTWSIMPSPTTQHLKSVWGTSATNIYASGENGTLLHYDGTTWVEIQTPVTVTLRDIHGSNESDIYISTSNGNVLHFDGIEWAVTNTGITDHLKSVWVNASNDVYSVGYAGRIVHYNGIEWTQVSSGVSNHFYCVWTDSGSDVFVAGQSVMQYDGNTWEQSYFGGTIAQGIWGFSNNSVFIAGHNGKAYYFDGTLWTYMDTGNSLPLRSICGTSENDMFAVGDQGTILHYDGSIWTPMTSGTTNDLYEVWCNSPTDVFAVGRAGTILHYDGNAWSPMDSQTTMFLDGIWGAADNDVFAVGNDGTILHYNGSTWEKMDTVTPHRLRYAWGTSGNDVFVAGDMGTILHYDGSSWTIMDNHVGINLYGISGRSGTNIFAVGPFGNILRYGEMPNVAPDVVITAPANGSAFSEDVGPIAFQATATDPEDGDISASVTWTSDIDGAFTSPYALSVGTHTVSATATDSGGLSDTNIITITITPHETPSVPVTVSSGTAPIENLNVYLFSSSGAYLGTKKVTDEYGQAWFDLSIGAEVMFRADYLGYQFWSESVVIETGSQVDILIPQQDVTITVQSLFDTPLPLQGVRVYLFTAAGSYMNQYQNTDQNGMVAFTLPEKGYKVRADYLGRQYWSDEIIWQDMEITIPMADAEIIVSGCGQPLSDVNVYVFNENNSYLSISGTTDNDGMITFRLPEGNYKFRANYQGSQYWSDIESLIANQVNPITISTGGGSFELTVLKGDSEPLSGVNCYVFSESGSYLGMTGITNNDGFVSFDLSNGSYKIRIDCLGYQFWSEVYNVPTTLAADFMISHQDVTITVNTGFQGTTIPLEGVKAYLFTASGAYMNQNFTTDAGGQVVFSLPNQAYKVRVDYMNQQFWSGEIIQQDTGIMIPMTDAEILVTGSGHPLASTPVYVFSGSGAYLSLNQLTDQAGSALFRLPASGTYKFRANYQGSQYWTNEVSLLPDQVNVIELSTGGGTFSFTVLKGTDDPLVGVNCYVFSESGAYLGLTAVTSSEGMVSFSLADGRYQFRVDYLGYQFWSDVYNVPATLADDFMISHQDVTISANTDFQGTQSPLADVKIYLFTAAGAYMNQNFTTDADGQVVFSLPNQAYKVRVDYMNQQFWSGDIIQQNTGIMIPMADAEILVTGSGYPLASTPVYVFSGSGAYLSLNQLTNQDGSALFRLPASGTYKFRANYQGSQYWTNEVSLLPDQVNVIELSTGG